MMSTRIHSWASAALALSVAACVGPGMPPAELPNAVGPVAGSFRLQAVSHLPVEHIRGEGGGFGDAARRAVDGNPETAWITPTMRPATAWLMMRFSRAYSFAHARIRTSAMPEGTTFKFDVSNDAVSWEPASGRLKFVGPAPEVKELHGRGRYLRLRFFNSESRPIDRFAVYEIEVHGDTLAAPAPTAFPAPTVAPPDGASPHHRHLPDWKAVAPRSIFVDGRRLRFDTAIANLGPGYLQIRNRMTGTNAGTAYQEVLDDAGQIIFSKACSRFVYVPSHGHNHVDDIARYELRQGALDGPLIRTASKVSFCVEDSFKYRSTNLASKYPDCTPQLMGVTPGYADLYSSNLPGQEFDIGDLPAGDYYMIVNVDPFHRFLDYSRTNNSAWTRVSLDPSAGTVTVRGSSR
jgi:Lysyl oxidase